MRTAPPSTCRASLPRRGPGAASSAVPTPRVAPPHSTARADVGCSARVWARLVRSATPLCRVPIGRGCSAREGVIWSAGLVAPRCWQRYSGRPPGRKVPAGARTGGSRLTPGGGQVMPCARRLLGVLGAAPPAISRRKSVPRRVRGLLGPIATPQRRPRPCPRRLRCCPGPGESQKRPGSQGMARGGRQGASTRSARGAQMAGYSGQNFMRAFSSKS